ncbi:MAG: MarR family transcriptional regulator [Betaproteobacteria bacterium]|nr:MarR family transcriptional regulator [Betaproteobacteria bacterium]
MTKGSLTPAQKAAKEAFLPVLRDLARTYQAFARYSAVHIRELGLTPPQFDVISTLGNTPGMPLHRLAEKTLITKGTLTGILDRLEQKGLLRREVPARNRRSFIAVLTPEGERLFNDTFPAHVAFLKERLDHLERDDMARIRRALQELQALF